MLEMVNPYQARMVSFFTQHLLTPCGVGKVLGKKIKKIKKKI